MWSNVISIDKQYEKEIGYILDKLQNTKDLSYAIEESEDRIWMYLASVCELQDVVEEEINKILEVVFLSFIKLRFFLDRLTLNTLSHAKCALLSSLVHFDREFEKNIVMKVVSNSLDYNIDGLMNFRLRALKDSWEELAEVAQRLLDGSNSEQDIFDIASFITGSDGKKSQLMIKDGNLKNVTFHKSVEVVNLFEGEEYNLLDAIIKEKPSEIVIENCHFSSPMSATLKKIARVIEK